MTKFKALFILVCGGLLAVFIIQNWQYPNPPIHFLGFQFLPFPQSVILLGFFAVGFLSGWLTNAIRIKRRQSEALPEQTPGE